MALMVFVDETGDHSMETVDKDFPVFVLAFLLCEQDKYVNEIMPAFTKFKVDQFGHDGVILQGSGDRVLNLPELFAVRPFRRT